MSAEAKRQQSELRSAAQAQLPVICEQAEWKPLGGLDTDSAVWEVDGRIVKAHRVPPFRARMLMRALHDIHACLSPRHLAPRLISMSYDGTTFVMEFERVEASGIALPAEVGFALGKAHTHLEHIPIKSTLAWTGFYGEFHEFRFLVPLVEDAAIRQQAERILGLSQYRERTDPVHYIHRDLNPSNVLRTSENVYLIDWEMAYGGHREDDVAMAICCLADLCETGEEKDLANGFLEGYRQALAVAWAELEHPVLRSAIALAGLRQAVAGWFSDGGDTSASYWPNIRNRLKTACILLDVG